MGIFKKKNNDIPHISPDECVPVLRCSICTGEQVLCVRDRKTRELHELMLIRTPGDLEGFCSANGLSLSEIEKVY